MLGTQLVQLVTHGPRLLRNRGKRVLGTQWVLWVIYTSRPLRSRGRRVVRYPVGTVGNTWPQTPKK